ncbi:MAG: hypothetical protein AAF653_14440, partial [Chloroflexota bacterium]
MNDAQVARHAMLELEKIRPSMKGALDLKHCNAHPDCQVTVLCGHTHGGGDVRMLPNLRVRVSTSDYQMQIEGVFQIR